MPPATSFPLNRTWLRLRGRDKWLPVTATMECREWITRAEPAENDPSRAGHWRVAYFYEVDGKRYLGRYTDFASEDDPYPWPGEALQVRYNPRQPSESYYPLQRTQAPFVALCIVAAVVMATLLFIVLLGQMRHTQ